MSRSRVDAVPSASQSKYRTRQTRTPSPCPSGATPRGEIISSARLFCCGQIARTTTRLPK